MAESTTRPARPTLVRLIWTSNTSWQWALTFQSPSSAWEVSASWSQTENPRRSRATPNEPFLEWLIALSAMDKSQIPNSISVSYGENEHEIPLPYAKQVCNMFAQLGARGKSVMIASGDSGVGSFCQANDGDQRAKVPAPVPQLRVPMSRLSVGVSAIQDRL